MPSPTPENRGPLLNIGTWLALVAMGLFACAKLVTKWATNRSLEVDDCYTALAMILAVGQTAAISMSVRSGLGKHEAALGSGELDHILQASYAAQILYVATIYVIKLGALQFLLKLARPGHKRTMVKVASLLIWLWLFAAILCLSIQCDLPHPWTAIQDTCFDQLAFWTVNAVLDMVSQLLISLLPIYLLYHFQLSPRRKRVAMASFAPNLLTIPLTVLRLIFLFQLSHTNDLPFDAFGATLVMDVHTNLSIITVCIPFLKPIVESLSLGIVTADMVTTSAPTSTSVARAAASLRSFYGWTRLQGTRNNTTAVPRGSGSGSRKGPRQTMSEESMDMSLVPATNNTTPSRRERYERDFMDKRALDLDALGSNPS